MGGFDELIEHLLNEIALAGSQGERVTFCMHFVATAALAAKELEFETRNGTLGFRNNYRDHMRRAFH